MATSIIPVFRVADATASVEWYRQLGFEFVFEHRFAPKMPAYVGIKRDDALIHLSEHTGDAPGPSVAYIWVDEVDPLAELFGVTVDEMPWARDCEIVDPDGNRLQFAEPVPVT